jgi:hypothetical protein
LLPVIILKLTSLLFVLSSFSKSLSITLPIIPSVVHCTALKCHLLSTSANNLQLIPKSASKCTHDHQELFV